MSFKTGSSVITFADRAQFWFDNMHDIVRGRTWDSMTSAINKHLLPALKDVPVDAIDEDVAQSFVTTLTMTLSGLLAGIAGAMMSGSVSSAKTRSGGAENRRCPSTTVIEGGKANA